MTKKTRSAIGKTISEARRHRRENPEDASTIMDMDRYRQSIQASSNYHDAAHPNILRGLAELVVGTASYVLAPVITVGELTYLGGRKLYERAVRKYEPAVR